MVYRLTSKQKVPIQNRMMLQLQRHWTASRRMNLPASRRPPPRKVGWRIYEWARSRAEERLTSSILLSSLSSLFSWRDLLSRKLQNWDQLKDFVPSRFVSEPITPKQILLRDPVPILLKYWPPIPALPSRGHRRGQWESVRQSPQVYEHLGFSPSPNRLVQLN